MKKTIKGVTYDTESAKLICNWPGRTYEEELYRTPGGSFFILRLKSMLDGKIIKGSVLFSDCIGSAKPHRVDQIIPITRRQALVWAIRTQMPRTFHKDLARFLK